MPNLADILTALWIAALVITTIFFIIGVLMFTFNSRRKNLVKYSPDNQTDPQFEAHSIIESAQEKAAKIIRESRLFNRQVSDKISHILSKEGEEVQTRTQELSHNLEKEASIQLNKYVKKYQQSWQQTLDDITKESTKQLVAARSQMQQSIDKQLETMNAELNLYKEEEKMRFIKHLNEKMPQVLKDLVGHSIPIKIHEDLVRESLESAIHENLLDSHQKNG